MPYMAEETHPNVERRAKTRDIHRLLSDLEVMRLAVGFMVQTGLLKQYNQVDWNTVNTSGN